MNILIFVMSILMMLTLLTYGRLDMYRSFVVMKGEFERYMTEHERHVINRGAQQWYEWTTLTSKNAGSKKSSPKEASPKLSIYSLFHPELGQESPHYAATREILKKLIANVFEEQSAFKKAQEKNPHLIEDLVQAIERAGSRLTAENKPLKNIDNLENLDLENPVLQDVYYLILKGYQIEKTDKPKVKPILDLVEETDESEETQENHIEEHVHDVGTISLLDFISLNPNKTKIRLFLAPKALLLTIFGDSHTVNEIIQTRLDLYRQISGDKDNQPLNEQFKQKFSSRVHQIPETMLDYTVTGTDPRLYEVQ